MTSSCVPPSSVKAGERVGRVISPHAPPPKKRVLADDLSSLLSHQKLLIGHESGGTQDFRASLGRLFVKLSPL